MAKLKANLRKLVVILFLSSVFMAQLGYFFISNFQRLELKESMREELQARSSEKEMQTIVLEDNSTSIRWEDDENEFYLNGKLYDVASFEKQNGKTLIHCVCDKDETQLVNDVAKTVASANEKTTGKESKQVVKFHLSDYVLFTTDRTAHSIITPLTKYIDFDSAISGLSPAVDTDPPRA